LGISERTGDIMSDEIEMTTGAAGLDRRDFIRKSAIVGGMVWAAPAVSSLGSRAFAAGTPMDGVGVSGFAFYVENEGSASYKFEWNGILTGGLSEDLAPCVGGLSETLQLEYCDAEQTAGLVDVTTATVNGEVVYTINVLEPIYGIKWIVVKEGPGCWFKAFDPKVGSLSFTKTDALGWSSTPQASPPNVGKCA